MKLEWQKDVDGNLWFKGQVDFDDVRRAAELLPPFDLKVLDDCSGLDKTAADLLLALELLFRRREQGVI
jgi:hypothetical protein